MFRIDLQVQIHVPDTMCAEGDLDGRDDAEPRERGPASGGRERLPQHPAGIARPSRSSRPASRCRTSASDSDHGVPRARTAWRRRASTSKTSSSCAELVEVLTAARDRRTSSRQTLRASRSAPDRPYRRWRRPRAPPTCRRSWRRRAGRRRASSDNEAAGARSGGARRGDLRGADRSRPKLRRRKRSVSRRRTRSKRRASRGPSGYEAQTDASAQTATAMVAVAQGCEPKAT